MKFSIKDFFSKCDQIHRKLQIWSHLLKKSLMENFTFCVVCITAPFVLSRTSLQTVLNIFRDFIANSTQFFLLENKFWTVLNFPWDSNTNCWHLSGNSFQTEFHIIRELVPNKVQCYHRFHSKQYLILSVISFQKVLNCIWEFTSNSI